MTDATPPASRQELIGQYCAAAARCDWRGMYAAKQEMVAREEYDIAAEIRRAQEALHRAETRVTAAHTELSVAEQALVTGRDSAPLAAEQASIVANPRLMAQATAAAAYWCDALPKLEQAVSAAEKRCQDKTQSVSNAQAHLDRLLAAAYARVLPLPDDDRSAKP